MKELTKYVERIHVDGDFFYDYCEKCKQERMHYIYMLEVNQAKEYVKYASICHHCLMSARDFNKINDELELEPPHQVFWNIFIFSIRLWNSFIVNSQVHSDDLPLLEDHPVIRDDTFRGM